MEMCEVTEVLLLRTPSLPPAPPGPPPDAVLRRGWGLFLRAMRLGPPRTPSPPPPPYTPPCEEEEEEEEEEGPETEGGAGGGGGSMARDWEEAREGRWWEKG